MSWLAGLFSASGLISDAVSPPVKCTATASNYSRQDSLMVLVSRHSVMGENQAFVVPSKRWQLKANLAGHFPNKVEDSPFGTDFIVLKRCIMLMHTDLLTRHSAYTNTTYWEQCRGS
jgi:hypothetical protein